MVALLALLACTDRVEPPAADTGDSGADSAPLDADADGYTTADDCDDGNSAVHPGAAERCDARDWNCDGNPYDPGVCGEPINLDEVAVGTWDGTSASESVTYGQFLGDMDGDGRAELGFNSGREYFVVAGGSDVSVGRSLRDDAFAWWHVRDDSGGSVNGLAAGDVNGDGASDLWLFSGSDHGTAVLLGPSTRWGRDQEVEVAADANWSVGAFDAAVAEVDADGFSDGAFYSVWSAGTSETRGGIFLVRGGPRVGETPPYSAPDVWIDCPVPYDIAAGDVTGDGFGDILVARGDDVALLDGLDLPGADGADCDAVGGTFVVPPVGAGGYTSWGFTAAVVGDWTGDGIDDWMGVDDLRSVDHDTEGALYVVPGGPDAGALGIVDVETVAVASLLGGADGTHLGGLRLRAVGDVNGDGALEVATTMDTPDTRIGLILPSARFTGLDGALPRQILRLQAPPGDGIPYAPSLGDYDGDGFLDVLVTSQNWGGNVGRAWLVSGAGIPWGEPGAW